MAAPDIKTKVHVVGATDVVRLRLEGFNLADLKKFAGRVKNNEGLEAVVRVIKSGTIPEHERDPETNYDSYAIIRFGVPLPPMDEGTSYEEVVEQITEGLAITVTNADDEEGGTTYP